MYSMPVFNISMNFNILPKNRTTQRTTMLHGLRMALNTGIKYDGIYLLRWDYNYTRAFEGMNSSTCWADPLPRDFRCFEEQNYDALIYIPGAETMEMHGFMELDES